jgi:hypothetical protein
MNNVDDETKQLYGELLNSLGVNPPVNGITIKTNKYGVSRRSVDSADPNSQVKCAMCGKSYKRITPTHLKSKCVESITIAEYIHRYPTSPIVSENLKELCGVTEAAMIEKYGEEEGKIRWKSYCDVQAETNTFEYKEAKYGMTIDEFNAYNNSRSQTIQNMIDRHGVVAGMVNWNIYCEQQRYTTSLEYFVETYGLEDGTEKYDAFCIGRASVERIQSKIELSAYEDLVAVMPDLQLSFRLDNPHIGPYDYGDPSRKKLIEFYGSYWHADPDLYDRDFYFKQKGQHAYFIWSRDQAKRTYANNQGYEVFVIWEKAWYKDKETVINEIKEWYYATN